MYSGNLSTLVKKIANYADFEQENTLYRSTSHNQKY